MSRPSSSIQPHEQVLFFPTCGCRNLEDDGWRVRIHGWVFESVTEDRRREAMIRLIRRTLQLDARITDSQTFRQRIWPFLVDGEIRREVRVRLAGREFDLPPSAANGHFVGDINIPDQWLQAGSPGQDPRTARSLHVETVPLAADPRTFVGRVQLLEPEGRSVISDLDDTVKQTNVLDRRELMANTFLRPFRAVPGMAELYRSWQQAGADFHYVSASPWQLFVPLLELLNTQAFPAGTLHLRWFRPQEDSLLEWMAGSEHSKREAIERLLTMFPRRRFLLVGDSGERDPEIYGEMARRYDSQVERILIRNVSGESTDSPRMEAAFTGIAPEQWALFDDGHDVSYRIPGQDA